MKKTLYGTTALVAMSLAIVAATPASAQAPAQGFNSTNFQFTVGGLARGFVGGFSQSDNVSNGSTAANSAAPALTSANQALTTQRFDIQRDWRLDLTAGANLPNGMRAVTVVQLQNLSVDQTSAFSESYLRRNWVAVTSSFGELRIGATDNVSQLQAKGAMDAFTPGSSRVGKLYDYIQTSNNVFGRDDTALGQSNSIRLYDRSSEKILYMTPRIEGFQLGANYTPEASKDKNSAAATASGGLYQRGWAVSGDYVNTFDGFGVRASASYLTWKSPNNSNNAGQTPSDPSAWGVGLGFTYLGFDLGGSYGSYKNVLNGGGRVNGGAALAATSNSSRFIGDGRGWELGVGYTMGPARVSINYWDGQMKDIKNHAGTATAAVALTNAGKDSLKTISLSGSYTMGPGVNLEATVFNARSTGAFTSATIKTDQSATGVITGLILSF
jgi:outer membrane protein OmpU